MFPNFRFSIRLKILVALLAVVTIVVSLITFTMANLFHDDKKAYIKDLASIVALSTAQECHALLNSYGERLKLYGHIMRGVDMSPERKSALLKDFFQDFENLIGIEMTQDGRALTSVYDGAILEEAGITKAELTEYRAAHPFPEDVFDSQRIFVENSTVSDALPTLTIAVQLPQEKDEIPPIVSMVVRLDELQSLSGRSDVFEVTVVDAAGRLLAHPDPTLVARGKQTELPAEVREMFQSFSSGVTLEFDRYGEPMVGGFADVGLGGAVAIAQIPTAAAYLASRDLLNRLVVIALALLITAVLYSIVGSRRITRPIVTLCKAAGEIGKGRFDVQVPVESRDEIGTLADSFNQMVDELKTRDEALDTTQEQLIQSEKMAAFGQLGAGIAHEIKNPLAGIQGLAEISQYEMAGEVEVQDNLRMIVKEAKRCAHIIDNLLRFARREKADMEETALNQVVLDSIAIVSHQLGISRVQVEKALADELPMISGNSNQLQQVFMNFLINAEQAMGGKPGSVRAATRKLESGEVEVRFTDTGPGIPEDIQQKIFEPFFTTKPVGEGTGLGLSVSFGIIKDHEGDVRVESAVGEGCTFIVTFPPIESVAARTIQDQALEADAELVRNLARNQ